MKETLTSRERVIRTLKRQPVDRFPIDLGCTTSSSISAFAYRNLREYLGLPMGEIFIPDVVQLTAYVEEDIMRRFHLDFAMLEKRWEDSAAWKVRDNFEFTVPAAMNPVLNDQGEWVVRKGAGRMRMPSGGYFFDGDWLSEWGSGNEDRDLAVYAAEAERIYKETPYATCYLGLRGGGFSAFFGNMDRLIQMIDDPDTVIRENGALCERSIKKAEKIIRLMGSHIQLIKITDDMGTQNGPMCRPSVIEQCCAPFIKKFCDFVHRNSDIKILLHCCGSIKPLIPMLIDCGVDALNPVQVSADNMDPRGLKKEFGDRIIFWGGGCNTQQVLGVSSPEKVAQNVKELAGIFKQGGGFVFNQVHNIMGNVKPENIVSMLDTAYKESFF